MTGRFVWYDLMTRDVKQAVSFYTEVIGWRTEIFAPGSASPSPSPYTMWVTQQGPIGGVVTLTPEQLARCAQPTWMGHVEVDDLDAAVAKVKATGGSVPVPPTPIPEVRRFAMIADPQGATLSLFQPQPPEQAMPPHDRSKHGEVSWNELYAADAFAVFPFYRDLLGWTLQDDVDMGPAGKYLIFGQRDEQYGGMMTKMPGTPAPVWTFYIRVDDLDATLTRAVAKGAAKLFDPMKVPDGSRVVQLRDPQGATFALHGE